MSVEISTGQEVGVAFRNVSLSLMPWNGTRGKIRMKPGADQIQIERSKIFDDKLMRDS